MVQGEDFDTLAYFTDVAICFFFRFAVGGGRGLGGFRRGVLFFRFILFFAHARFVLPFNGDVGEVKTLFLREVRVVYPLCF